MTSVLKKSLLGVAAVSMLAVTASPADAQYRRYRHHDSDAGVAIGAGILGLGIGAAIASSNRGYYGRGYEGGYRHCRTVREYDPYSGRRIRVRYC